VPPRRRFHPSPGLVVAVVALVAALGGVAIAGPIAHQSKGLTTKKVTSIATSVADSEIAAKAPGLSVKSAGSAQTAQTTQNIKRIDLKTGQTSGYQSIGSGGGMDLQALCLADGPPATEIAIRVVANTAGVANSSMTIGGPSPSPDPAERSGETPVIRGIGLAQGDSFAVISDQAASVDKVEDSSSAAGTFAQAEGQIIYENSTNVVSIAFHTYVDHQGANAGYCEFDGTMTIS